jgi:hypothetical protein
MSHVQIRRPVLEAIAAGTVTCAFRRWDRPRVRPGGTQRTPIGVLEFTAVEPVDEADLTADDARAAGFADLAALQRAQRGDGQLYRVALRLAGPDPRVALRAKRRLSKAERAEIDARLARMDRSSHGLADARPALRAGAVTRFARKLAHWPTGRGPLRCWS